MTDLSWITARPVAHRGLHDAAGGIVENTATAFQAAIAGNFAIECDLQVSADGEAMVHHDHALGRLTEGTAALASLPAVEIAAVRFKASPDRILRLGELLDLVAGRVTLLLELKSRFDGDLRLTRRVAEVTASYRGPVAAMSFDPKPLEALRRLAPALSRGIVAQRDYSHPDWDGLPAAEKRRLAFLLHVPVTRPHFIAYAVRDLPAVAPAVAKLWGMPLLTWTVRTEEERARAARYADQMIFEGFRP
jgi:glycerophosphoryl diester phosphodiesterase